MLGPFVVSVVPASVGAPGVVLPLGLDLGELRRLAVRQDERR